MREVIEINGEPPASTHDVEFELVVLCARTHLDHQATRRLFACLSSDVDWRRVWRLSAVHAVQPLVYKTLIDGFDAYVPAEVLPHLKRPLLQAAAQNLRLAGEMARVVRVLEARALHALPFKGPVLAETAYGSLGLRQCGDIDLLVASDAYEAVERALVEDGYRLPEKVRQLRPMQKRMHLLITRQYPFVHRDRFFIDLHTGIMPMGYHFPLRFEQLWERRRIVTVAGQTMSAAQPEDMLLVLCYQGLKNQWARLKHICDVAELLRAYPEMDWDVVWERARAMHGERIVRLGLHLAHDVGGVHLPETIRRAIAGDEAVRQLDVQVGEALRGRGDDELDLAWRFRLHMKAQNHWSTRLRYGAYTLVRRVEEWLEEATPREQRTETVA